MAQTYVTHDKFKKTEASREQITAYAESRRGRIGIESVSVVDEGEYWKIVTVIRVRKWEP